MKPRFIGGTFDDITRYLKELTLGIYATRTLIDITPVAVAANSAVEQTFTIKRLATNESIIVSLVGAQTAGVTIANARVSAADTLAITFINPTAGSITPASGDHRLIRLET